MIKTSPVGDVFYFSRYGFIYMKWQGREHNYTDEDSLLDCISEIDKGAWYNVWCHTATQILITRDNGILYGSQIILLYLTCADCGLDTFYHYIVRE